MDCSAAHNYTSCFVCNSSSDSSRNPLTTAIKFSDNPVYKLIESFAEVTLPDELVYAEYVCHSCFRNIEEYDELITKAEILQMKLLVLFRRSQDNFKCAAQENPDFEIEKLNDEQDETTNYSDYEEPKEILPIEEIIYEEEVESVLIDAINSEELKHEKSKSNIKWKCEICGKSFKFQSRMLQHAKVHDKKISRRVKKIQSFVCNIGECNKMFQSITNLNNHKQTHSEDRKFVCEVCGASYKTKDVLHKHKKIHQNLPDFQCDMCEKKFKNKVSIYRHMKIDHIKSVCFCCHLCGKQVKAKVLFDAHMSAHANTRQFACETCGRSFNSVQYLKKHIKTHAGLKPYSCEICNARFTARTTLRVHMDIHNGVSVKKFGCNLCSLKFDRKYKVKAHQLKVHHLIETEENGPDENFLQA